MLRCEFCSQLFEPDYRHRDRQKCCQSRLCLAKAKQRRQRRWSSKECNRQYFRGRIHVDRMTLWRAEHQSDRRHAARRRRRVLQDALHTQVRILHEVFVGGEGVSLQDAVEPRLRALLHLGHLMPAGDTDDVRDVDAPPSAVSASDPIRTVGVLFVDRHNLPGVFFREQTIRCAGALLKVLPR